MAEECRGSGERSPEHGGCVESTATKRVRRPGEPTLAPLYNQDPSEPLRIVGPNCYEELEIRFFIFLRLVLF